MNPNRLVIHHFDPRRPSIGGIDTCIRGLVRFGLGVDFAIVGSSSGERPKRSSRHWQDVGVALTGRTVPALHVARLDDERTLVPNVVRLLTGMLASAAQIREANADVIQVHRAETVFLARRLFPTAHLDFFVHEDVRNWSRQTSTSHWRRSASAYARLVRRAAFVSDRVVSFSPTAAINLAEAHEDVLSVPTWFDPELFEPTPRERVAPQRLLWVGRLAGHKDPLLALQVLESLPEEYELTVVGDGELRDDVLDRVRRNRLEDRVHLRGSVAKSEVASLMRDHATLLMTSHSEGFPRVLVESLASGRPVVATSGADTGGRLEVGVNGGRATGRDPSELAELVLTCTSIDAESCRASVADLAAPDVVARILERDHG